MSRSRNPRRPSSADTTASSQTPISSNATPLPINREVTNSFPISRDVTGTTNLADADTLETSSTTGKTAYDLLDQHILSPKAKLPVTEIALLVLIATIAGIFIQDNGSGRLADWPAIKLTLIKCGILSTVLVAVIIGYKLLKLIMSLGSYIWNKFRRWRKQSKVRAA